MLSTNERWFRAKGEAGVVGRFDHVEDIDVAASEKAGEKIMKKIPVLLAKTHLSPDWSLAKVPTDPVARKEMIERFPDAWAHFLGENPPEQGTPLNEEFKGLPAMLRPEIMKYEMAGISTWEQIGELSDAGCQRVGFGTTNKRKEVMLRMGKTPPGAMPNIQLSEHMTAEQALLSMPGGKELVAKLNQQIEAHNAGETPNKDVSIVAGPMVPDLSHPVVQAAIQAAVAAALAAQNPVGAAVNGAGASPAPEASETLPAAPAGQKKRGGWPRGWKRGADGKPVPPDAPVPQA